MNINPLKYTSAQEKTYGIAGMAITLVATDSHELLREIRLDNPAGNNMIMSHDFGLTGNPRMSAKILWNQSLSDLKTSVAMALGNIVCRRYVLSRTRVSDEDLSELHRVVREEALSSCSLDNDEADRLFNSCYNYSQRLFGHQGVQNATHSFCRQLEERRTLSQGEVLEILARLGLH